MRTNSQHTVENQEDKEENQDEESTQMVNKNK